MKDTHSGFLILDDDINNLGNIILSKKFPLKMIFRTKKLFDQETYVQKYLGPTKFGQKNWRKNFNIKKWKKSLGKMCLVKESFG